MKEDSEDFEVRRTDQVDGVGVSFGNKKYEKATSKRLNPMDWSGGSGASSIVHPHASTSLPSENQALVFGRSFPQTPVEHRYDRSLDDPTVEDDWSQEPLSDARESFSEVNIPRQTVEELKTFLSSSPRVKFCEQEDGKPESPFLKVHTGRYYRHGGDGCGGFDGQQEEVKHHGMLTTFQPNSDASRTGARPRGRSSIHQPSNMDSSSSFMPDEKTIRQQPQVSTHSNVSGRSWGETRASHTGKENKTHKFFSDQMFIAAMEQIKQQIARDNTGFVRFEATDLHGVSRSKTVPVRFFQEKSLHGVPMPRSYLELTLCPRSNEVDHANTANFNSDVLLIPDLSTFRALPWADNTARVICDPCTVTGSPLCTSPRLITKQLLGQLQSLGFSLHSSFTYECCVIGAPDRIGLKTLMFPATTLLGSHDLPFFQQLMDNMYCMGADIDSISSASGPAQMEISLRPEFGISAADSAFTFRTGIKEMARKQGYLASFFTEDGLFNSGVLSHCLWDATGKRSLFQSGEKADELSEIGRRWLAGLLSHSAALSCLMSPSLGCRSHIAKTIKDPKATLYATCGSNDNSSSFNIKCHGGREMQIENKLGSALANPYIALAATVAAGLDGIRRNLNVDSIRKKAPGQQREFAIPVKLEDALEALEGDHVMCSMLGEPFVQYFIALKKFEIETQELDDERNKSLEYFI